MLKKYYKKFDNYYKDHPQTATALSFCVLFTIPCISLILTSAKNNKNFKTEHIFAIIGLVLSPIGMLLLIFDEKYVTKDYTNDEKKYHDQYSPLFQLVSFIGGAGITVTLGSLITILIKEKESFQPEHIVGVVGLSIIAVMLAATALYAICEDIYNSCHKPKSNSIDSSTAQDNVQNRR